MTTIGVCEDDAQLRSVLARAFRADGFEVVSVATGAGPRAGVRRLRAFLPKLCRFAGGPDACPAP